MHSTSILLFVSIVRLNCRSTDIKNHITPEIALNYFFFFPNLIIKLILLQLPPLNRGPLAPSLRLPQITTSFWRSVSLHLTRPVNNYDRNFEPIFVSHHSAFFLLFVPTSNMLMRLINAVLFSTPNILPRKRQ